MRNAFEKVFMGAAGSAGGAGGLDVDDVFSTTLYKGNATERDITTGIDISGEGGLLWIKNRSSNSDHSLFSTLLGARKSLNSNSSQSAYASTSPSPADKDLKSFNSDGFSIFAAGYNANLNTNGASYTSFTWRKAPKFFDCVTYTGSGNAGLTVDHNLGSVPGCVIIKSYDNAKDWAVYHRGVDATNPEDYAMVLQKTDAREGSATWFNDTAPTDTQFTVGNKADINTSNKNYVAYLFAHHAGDGEFGPDSDQDIIKCGSFTMGSTTLSVDLGFEPQWLMVKKASGTGQWMLVDNMRGWNTDSYVGTNIYQKMLYANLTNAEGDASMLYLNSTGFTADSTGTGDFIYMAIKRGSLFPPEAGTEVFKVDAEDAGSSSNPPLYVSGFPVDFALRKQLNNTASWAAVSRLTGTKWLATSSANAEDSVAAYKFDYMNGWSSDAGWNAAIYSWMWKRAPSFFDVVCYKGDGTLNQTFSHGLAAKPDMVWIKSRGGTQDWWVALDDSIVNLDGRLNNSGDFGYSVIGTFTDTTVQTLNQNQAATNYNGVNYIAYLFATLAGVSKIGSVTHSGTTNVDCGFSAGSRFVMLKRTDATGDWYVWDSVRGIVSGNDPYLLLNTNGQNVTSTDYIDPLNAGFTISDNFTDGDYIFYAIA